MNWLQDFRELLFPRLCACCGDSLLSGEHTVCTLCRVNMPLTHYWEQPCNYAEQLFAGRFPFEQASALMFFKQHTDYQTLIHRMKYGSRRDIAYVMGEIYGHFLSMQTVYQSIEIVVPVPLHWSRFTKRGYNQSEHFAAGVAHSMGIKVEAGVLYRYRRTHTQALMGGIEKRADNVEGAFAVRNVRKIASKQILLVDDVVTTGSTIEACATAIANSSPSTIINVGSLAIVSTTRYNKVLVDDADLVGIEPVAPTSDVDSQRNG